MVPNFPCTFWGLQSKFLVIIFVHNFFLLFFYTHLQYLAFSYISFAVCICIDFHMILKLKWNCLNICIVYPTRFGIYPTQIINFTFSVLYIFLTFSINPPTQSHFEKNALLLFLFFLNHSSHLIPPNPTFEIILHFCSVTFTVSIIHPTQFHIWKCFAFLNNFPFFNLSSHSQT